MNDMLQGSFLTWQSSELAAFLKKGDSRKILQPAEL